MHAITDTEALDWFMHGLHPVLQKGVLIKDPHTCEDALIAAERIGAIYNYVMRKGIWKPRQEAGGFQQPLSNS